MCIKNVKEIGNKSIREILENTDELKINLVLNSENLQFFIAFDSDIYSQKVIFDGSKMPQIICIKKVINLINDLRRL